MFWIGYYLFLVGVVTLAVSLRFWSHQKSPRVWELGIFRSQRKNERAVLTAHL